MFDLARKVFGRLTVIREGERQQGGRTRGWLCRCSCGKTITVRQRSLRSGKTKSCGCLQREAAAKQAKKMGAGNVRHGQTDTPEWLAWKNMWDRCTNPNQPSFKHYGARGVRVCAPWKEFQQFRDDMGPRPAGCSLDRIDSKGNYEPGNCRWADQKTQQRNRRWHRLVTFKGETRCVGEWSEIRGIPLPRLHARLFYHGWTTERAMTEPVKTPIRRKKRPT